MNVNVATGHINRNNHLEKKLQLAFRKAKSVDIIVSFLMESGVKLLEEELAMVYRRKVPIRILTGNYLNITQPTALYKIKDILGDQVDLRFFNDKSRSFHPKAYLFTYDDYSEIYIGSSNLSRSALTSGVEWNYRIDSRSMPEDHQYFKATFEDLFLNHSEIITDQVMADYSKSWIKPKLKFSSTSEVPAEEVLETAKVQPLFEPRGAQLEALYHLKKTREEGFSKGLVVAATGIGKTYLAAFDSREFDRVLFVAHREEILKQAKASFFNIRPDKKGGLFMAGSRDLEVDFLFGSVQTLGKEENLALFKPDHFDYIVIDEFHHAVAGNYQKIINYFQPKFMLGLTATPDRLDNKDVYAICDYNKVYEVNLQSAINKGWLVPFRYYGIWDDSVDYAQIDYSQGKYNAEQLEDALSIHKRGALVLNHYRKYGSRRALGFCTSRKHADMMAAYFNDQGVAASAVYSHQDKGPHYEDRETALKKLRRAETQVVFSIDMFNEGLDVKNVDLVMFLRPTESPTIFLQQLGRGLRLDKDKHYLNVLDFIGNHKKANFAPYLLSGTEVGAGSGVPKKPEQFPEDCFVDFDFRLVDLFEKIEKAKFERLKAKELLRKHRQHDVIQWRLEDLDPTIQEEYDRIKAYLEKVPTRLELFTYMEDEVYNHVLQSGINPFLDYLGFLDVVGDATEEEAGLLGTIGADFLNMIEQTDMQKMYKMPLLLSFYNEGEFLLRPTRAQVKAQFMAFYAKPSNKQDLLGKTGSIQELEGSKLNTKIANAMNQPKTAFLKTYKNFFHEEEGWITLDEAFASFKENPAFLHHLKDTIDYRTRKFYKEKYSQKT